MFGTRYIGAIHGLSLTTWSMAGILGPVLVNYIREFNVTHVPPAQAYNITMYVMARPVGPWLHLQCVHPPVDERHTCGESHLGGKPQR